MDKLVLYNLAKMYYIDGLGQQEIANIMGLSRPQISRMLKEARSCHIVEITLNAPFGVSWKAQAEKLRQRLGLADARIISAGDYAQTDVAGCTTAVAAYAAEYLASLIPSCRKIGVGWGRTIYATVRATEHSLKPSSALFVPLMGNAGFSDPYYQTNSIVDRIAEKYKARSVFINTPAFVPTETLRQYMIQLNGLDQQDGVWENIDLALFSLGGPPQANAVTREIPDRETAERLLGSDAVGDVLGHFFTRDGSPACPENDVWCVTISLEQLKRIRRRICVALGAEKVDSIITAGEMGLYTELITDHYTAESILERL